MKDEICYMAQVICKNDMCFQFVTKEFAKKHPKFNIFKIKILENINYPKIYGESELVSEKV